MKKIYDCIIIGGGIAGLTAGVYMSRFHCKTCIIDDKQSRASLIPKSHNFPGFPNGISGTEILSRLTQQYQQYGQDIVYDTATSIKKISKYNFQIKTSKKTFYSKFVIIATGVVDIEPNIPHITFAIKNGLVGHCLICDAYEITGKRIGVIGNTKKCLREGFLLSKYSNDITLINIDKKIYLSPKEIKYMKDNNIKIINEVIIDSKIQHKRISIIKTENHIFKFEKIYSALGAKPRSELAIKLGVKHTKENVLLTDAQQATNIPGVYAVGDITSSINQMCVATSQGAIAAVDIYNILIKSKLK